MKRFLAMLLAVMLVVGVLPMSVLADFTAETGGQTVVEPGEAGGKTGGEPAELSETPSYLSKLEFRLGNGEYSEVTAQDNVYEVNVPADEPKNDNYPYLRLTLSDSAPTDSTLQVTFVDPWDDTNNHTPESGEELWLEYICEANMVDNTVTITVGVEGNTQTYTLKLIRTPVLDTVVLKNSKNAKLKKQADEKYILPYYSETVTVTARTYGADLYINGTKSTDGVVTPVWPSEGEKLFTLKVKAGGNDRFTEEQTFTVKFASLEEMTTGTCGENVRWQYNTESKTLSVAGSGAMTDFKKGATPWSDFQGEIETVNIGENITSVGAYAFYNASKLTNVILPSSVESIGTWAFSSCSSLSRIALPSNLKTIGQSAFNGSGLTGSIAIPASVNTVGSSAFIYCRNLTSATITNAMGEQMFRGCTLLSEVTFGGDGQGLKKIPSFAFAGTSVKTLVLPEGVETAEKQGYEYVDKFEATSVTLPKSYTGTDFTVFGTEVETLTITAGNPNFEQVGAVIYGLTDGAKTSVVKCNKAATGKITVADGVKSISANAFSGCGEITEVELPAGLETIGANAFKSCSKVKHIEIPEGITTLSGSIFSNAQSLETVVLPKSLTTMTKNSFFGNTALKTVFFAGDMDSWATLAAMANQGTFDNVDIVYHYGRTDVASVETQPTDHSFNQGADSTNGLWVKITKPEGTTVEAKWYVSDTKSYTGGTEVVTTVSDNGLIFYCSPDTTEVADKYYYCEITTKKGEETVKNYSRFAKVSVEEKKWDGEGTQANPYQISTPEHLAMLRSYVAAGKSTQGKYFKLTANVELPTSWTPIGTEIGSDTKEYTDTYCFDGVLDGNGQTITYGKGAKSLFRYLRSATIRNLYLKGEWIDGNGLAEGCVTATDVNSLIVENCKLLQHSSTKGSGFVGNTAGASFNSCQVESDVKIGVDQEGNSVNAEKIGSIVGTGSFSITNCKSEATVYGKDYVGGVCGYNGYAMRGNTVKNCTFSGEVIATGEYVGGILGGGYDSYTAPNAIGAQIINCAVRANITGARAVGGILGGEGGVDQAWDNSSQNIKNNLFYGGLTIVSKDFPAWDKNSVHSSPASNIGGSKGGIIGFERSLNKYNYIEDNYFYDVNNENTKGIGAVEHIDTSTVATMGSSADGIYYYNTARDSLSAIKEFVDGEDKTVRPGDWQSYQSVIKTGHNRTDDPMGTDADRLVKAYTSTEMTDGTLVAALNAGTNSLKNWMQGANGPEITDAVVAYKLEISGTYKTEYYIGDELDMSGAVFTVTKTDGTTETVPLSEVTIGGFDSSAQAMLTLTASYGSTYTTFNVRILKKAGEGTTTPSTIKVYFTLLGDTHHDESIIHTFKKNNLTTWLSKESYTVDLNTTVADLLEKVEEKHQNVSFSNPKGNWVDAVTYGDLTMTQLDNNTNSGWQYNVNRKHTELLVNEYFLENGDSVIFYWTDDYTQDMGSEGYGPSNSGPTGGSTTETVPVDKVTTVTPSASANSKGEATANVGSGTIKDAVSDAKKQESSAIVIAPEVKGDASKVTVNIPVSSAASVGKDAKADLTVKTEVGSVNIPASELKNLSGGGNLTISAEAKKDENGKTTGEVEVNITKGDEKVEMKGVSVTVPTENGKTNTVLVLVHEDGTEEVLKKSVSGENGVTGLVDGSCTVKAVEKTSDFGDTQQHWAKEAAEFVSAREIFQGTGSKTFAPDMTMDRAMVATVLYRLENAPETSGKTNFTDELAGWAKDGIAWANENEIVTGYAGQFNGDRPVSRQELAAMLYRYAKVAGLSTDAKGDLSKFTDGETTADWAKTAMTWAVSRGLFNGKTTTTLDPAGTATRAEVAVVIQRLVGLMVK